MRLNRRFNYGEKLRIEYSLCVLRNFCFNNMNYNKKLSNKFYAIQFQGASINDVQIALVLFNPSLKAFHRYPNLFIY